MLHTFSTLSLNISFLNLHTFSKPVERLEQIVTYDIEKLLSKSSELSKNLLLQLRQSLMKEWGSGSIGTLPEDSIQKLLTGVGFV